MTAKSMQASDNVAAAVEPWEEVVEDVIARGLTISMVVGNEVIAPSGSADGGGKCCVRR